jgi:hypothetical protein
MSAVPQCSAGWQAGFLQVLPAVQTHAQIQFRRLPASSREEAIQEAIASACVSYQLLAVQGRLHVARPDTLARFAVHAVLNGRHVGGRQETVRDALSKVAQARHRFRTGGIESLGAETLEWRQVAVTDRKASVPDIAAFRIDFAAWLKTLSRRDRRIIFALAAGEGTSRVADHFGLTAGRVPQLRRKYEHLWRSFQGEIAA